MSSDNSFKIHVSIEVEDGNCVVIDLKGATQTDSPYFIYTKVDDIIEGLRPILLDKCVKAIAACKLVTQGNLEKPEDLSDSKSELN